MSTSAVEKALDSIGQLIDEAKRIPFLNATVIDIEELSRLVEDIRLKMPDEINQARRIAQERRDILEEAKADAENIINNARQRADLMIEEHQVTKEATSAANDILRQAKAESESLIADAKVRAQEMTTKAEKWSNDIKRNASAYVETVIKDTDETLTKSVNDIRTLRNSVKDALARTNIARPSFDD